MAFQEGFQPNGGFIPPQSAGGNGGGAGGGVMVVTVDDNDTLDASYDDIMNAYNAGKAVIIRYDGNQHVTFGQLAYLEKDEYRITFMEYADSTSTYVATPYVADNSTENMHSEVD